MPYCKTSIKGICSGIEFPGFVKWTLDPGAYVVSFFGMARFSSIYFSVVLMFFAGGDVVFAEAELPEGRAGIPLPLEQVDSASLEKKSLGHQLLFYVPNRLIDLVDIFRLRLRVGPGLAANIRATDYLNGYAGSYKTIYVGLPGPRPTSKLRKPWGREDLKGFILAGVDATDDTPYHPGYGPAEFDVGLQLLFVGADAGIDPIEIGDFVAGFFLRDPKGDDF